MTTAPPPTQRTGEDLFRLCASPHAAPHPAVVVHAVHVQALTPWEQEYQGIAYCALCARHTRHRALGITTPARARAWGWRPAR